MFNLDAMKEDGTEMMDRFNNMSFNHEATNDAADDPSSAKPSFSFLDNGNQSKLEAAQPTNQNHNHNRNSNSASTLQSESVHHASQENTDPNQSAAPQTAKSIQPSAESSQQSTANPSMNQSALKKPSKKSKWKEAYNVAIREAKAAEKEKDYLVALRKFVHAESICRKNHGALTKKIDKVRAICMAHDLHETEEAFSLVEGGPWYLNFVTENYHLEATVEDVETEFVLSAEIFEKLYDYQRECLVWLWTVFQSPNGGILGDDMGLGKTVQMSAYLNGAFWSGLVRCVLLIVPVSVMAHWIKELGVWCSGTRIRKYHSSISKKRRAENLEFIARKGGLLITTYGMVQKNFKSMDITELSRKVRGGRVVREGKGWDYMVLDEGHKIKNHLIGTAKAVRQIPVENSNKIILSGTFLQNELSELWSLFDFISEGQLFGSYRAFNEEFATKINAGRMKNASRIQKQLSVKLTNLIKKTIEPYLIRRTKQEVRQNQIDTQRREESAGLSKEVTAQDQKKALTPILKSAKRELVVWVTLTDVQSDIYRTFLESDAVKETLNTTKSPLAALTVLKKICDHPFLLSDKMANCAELTQLAEVSRDRSVHNTLATANKMHVLLQLLRALVDDAHRVLVFSQFKIILSMIEPLLKDNNLPFIRLDGDTKIDERQKYVDAFNKMANIKVFLLSTKVGGLGLNLTGSDRVIIYDPAWNPATDAQAVDRSYRIGQERDVMVYRLVTCGTIEEKIYRRQISKVGLLKSVTGNSNQHRYFSKSELKEVFKLDDPMVSQTQLQFKQLHEHRVGTNAAFDRETNRVEQIRCVFGVSHHDLLFQTCPAEELEENPELKEHLEAVRKKLTAQTPRPKTAAAQRDRDQRALESAQRERVESMLDASPAPNHNEPRLANITEAPMPPSAAHDEDDAVFSEFQGFKFDDNYSGNNSFFNSEEVDSKAEAPNPFTNSSTSMEIDGAEDEEATEDDSDGRGDDFISANENNRSSISFDANISSIEPMAHDAKVQSNNGNLWKAAGEADAMDPAPSTATAKRTRTLRKKQNRFLADSESESESDHEAHQILNELDNFNFQRINSTAEADRVTANIIASTPMLQRVLSKKDREAKEEKAAVSPIKMQMPPPRDDGDDDDDELDITDIQKVIRAQPRRKRRKSLANLQHLLAREEQEHDEDSEATESEEAEAPAISPLQNEQSVDVPVQNVPHPRAVGNMSFGVDPMHFIPNRSPSEPLPEREPSMPGNPYLDSGLIDGLSAFSPPQNKSFVSAHQVGPVQVGATNQKVTTNQANPNESVTWNVDFNTSTQSPLDEQHQQSELGLHLSVLSPTQPGNAPTAAAAVAAAAAAEEPNMIESLLRTNYANEAQAQAAPAEDGDDDETDDEATLSDEEMFDAVHAAINAPFDDPSPAAPAAPAAPAVLASAMQIFNDAERMEKDASILQASAGTSPSQALSEAKKQSLRKNYKRYRRKSFVPQMDAFDDLDLLDDADDDEEEESAQQQTAPQLMAAADNEEGRVMVCEMHRRKAKAVTSFEYECVKCECFLSDDEKRTYQELLRRANEAEKCEDWGTAMEALMNAVQICNSEQSLHTRCVEMGRLLFQ